MLKSLRPHVNFSLIGGRRLISLRPLAYLSLAFASGIWASFLSDFAFFPILTIALIGLLFLFLSLARAWFIPTAAIFFFVLGFLYGLNDRSLSPDHISLSAPEGRISLEGTVMNVPEIVKRGKKETISFILDSKNFYRRGTLYPTRGKVQVFLHNCGTEIRYGDSVRLKGSLETPKRVSNPNAFDYRSYLAHQGIFNIFRGIGKFSVSRKIGAQNGFLLNVNRLRVHLQSRLSTLFPHPHSELASALILGFRKNIPDDIKEIFIKTGTAHLLAISGMNISLVVTLFYVLMSFLKVPRNINFVLSIFFIVIYTTLAGTNIPVLRAGIMGCMVFFGLLLSQERNVKSAFFFSFFLLLALDPSVLFSASFQLSFLAMVSLLYILPRFETKLFPKQIISGHPVWSFIVRSVTQSFLASLAATVGMLPVLLWYFNLFSVIGFICNLIAIPLCTLVIASTFVLLIIDLMCAPAAAFLSVLPLALFRFELWFITQLARVPFSHFYSPSPNLPFFIFYYGCLIVWLFSEKIKWLKNLAVWIMAASTVLFLLSAQLPMGRSILFDLGKTESFFISFSNGSKCLINTGRHFPNNQAYWIIRSCLMARAVHRLDAIVLTHIDTAHAGGLRTILEYVRARRIFTPLHEKKTKNTNRYWEFRTKKEVLTAGSKLQFGSNPGIFLEILTASNNQITSLVVEDRGQKALYIFSEDSETFNALLDLNLLNYDVVYLPHHHAPMSSSEKGFLKQVSTRYLVVNQREKVDEFLSDIGRLTRSSVLSVQKLGALEFIHSKKNLTYKHYQTA